MAPERNFHIRFAIWEHCQIPVLLSSLASWYPLRHNQVKSEVVGTIRRGAMIRHPGGGGCPYRSSPGCAILLKGLGNKRSN